MTRALVKITLKPTRKESEEQCRRRLIMQKVIDIFTPEIHEMAKQELLKLMLERYK